MTVESHRNIRASMAAYERWMASQIAIVPADIRLKHERMREVPFVFLRGTFYRWAEQFPMCSRNSLPPRG